MTTNDWLLQATAQLKQANIDTARLDALILLEDALHTNRTQLLAYPDSIIPHTVLKKLASQLKRRVQDIPLAYIRGKVEFYGRDFAVSPAVLVPRPESETMIELLLAQPELPADLAIADVGTGSGALGITAALELKNASVDLLEVDDEAIKIATMNVVSMATGVQVVKSDLLNKAPRAYDVLLCNLPYVPEAYAINKAATHEPRIAIFAGADGLNLYRRLFEQIQHMPNRPLLILTEALLFQHTALAEIGGTAGFEVRQTDNLIQVFQLAT